MRSYLLLAASFFSFTLSAMSTTIDTVINELQELCTLSESEAAVLGLLMEQGCVEDDKVTRETVILADVNKKLHACVRMLKNANCPAESRDDVLCDDFDSETCNSKTTDTNSPLCSLSNLKTGCDWIIRAAGLIWALQTFYCLLF